MKHNIVADGGSRLLQGQKAMASGSIEKKYAAQLAKAGPGEKKQIYQRMLEDYEQRKKKVSHKPSAGTLW